MTVATGSMQINESDHVPVKLYYKGRRETEFDPQGSLLLSFCLCVLWSAQGSHHREDEDISVAIKSPTKLRMEAQNPITKF